jgi:hypothetical protein
MENTEEGKRKQKSTEATGIIGNADLLEVRSVMINYLVFIRISSNNVKLSELSI